MTRTIALSVTLTLVIACTVLSQDARRAQQRQQAAFQQVFTLRGVEFTEDQQAEVKELRKKYTPQLVEIQRKHASIFTDEQRQAHREAFQAAREAGKQGRELREAVDAVVKPTDEQKEKLATVQKERADLFAEIQKELRALLTDDQRRQLRPQGRSRQPAQPPTHRDVKYGPHDRNIMDVWLAESDKPTSVLVSIHGGGFRGGNKSVSGGLLTQSLESGISVVAITYRLSDQAIAPAQFLDSARGHPIHPAQRRTMESRSDQDCSDRWFSRCRDFFVAGVSRGFGRSRQRRPCLAPVHSFDVHVGQWWANLLRSSVYP